MILDRQPLKVSDRIRASAFQGDDVVLLPAGAASPAQAGGRAGMFKLELAKDDARAVLARFGGPRKECCGYKGCSTPFRFAGAS